MIWNIFLVLLILATAGVWLYSSKRHVIHHRDRYIGAWFMSMVLLIVLCISAGYSADQQYQASKYKRSVDLVTDKQQQRDVHAEIVRTKLDAEQYKMLMSATPQTDMSVFFGSNASNFLIERARMLVQLNAEVNDLNNELSRKRIDLCAYADNLFTPRLFMNPECPERVHKTPVPEGK